MKNKLFKIREDLMYAMEQNSKTLLLFAINDLDTFIDKNRQQLNIESDVPLCECCDRVTYVTTDNIVVCEECGDPIC